MGEEEVEKKQRRQGPWKQKEWHDFLTRFFFITLVHVPPRPAESLKYHNQIKTREIKQETKGRPFCVLAEMAQQMSWKFVLLL